MGGLPRVGTDSEQGAAPERRSTVVWEGSGGHSGASGPFPGLRRNLMPHGKPRCKVEVRERSQAGGRETGTI